MAYRSSASAAPKRLDVHATQSTPTGAYLDSLSDADLDEELDLSGMGLGNMRRGDVLTALPIGNTFAHTGEISAIKGIQGSQGYPF